MKTLLDLVVERAEHHPDRGYRFLADGVAESGELSYAALDRRCRAISAAVREAGFGLGARALLLYPAGLDFVEGFWACAYAGVIAVPAPPPDPLRFERTAARLRAIAADCRPSLVLTDGAAIGHADIRRLAPELRDATIIETPRVQSSPDDWRRPKVCDTAPAVIQYTSGSTGAPRGVVVSHANFLHNLEMLKRFHGDQEHVVTVHWLPLFHDMGLIRGMMSPLHMGGDCIMMPPLPFVQRPYRWLSAVSRYRATVTGAPNFGYGLCTRKIEDAELESLDLSSLRVAFCSSEPIRASTVRAFIRKFARCGFSAQSFRPSYGLAEATVMVCGEHGRGPRFRACDRTALCADRFAEVAAEKRDAVEIACCGRSIEGQQVVTVTAEGRVAGPHEIGEIWVRGPSIARGYWENAAATEEVFGQRLATGEGPYMRTGDLGWLSASGELFVTGRKKDLIIVRGENYYPQDIESVVEAHVPELRQGCSAAFAVDGASGEQVVVVGEITQDGSVARDWGRILAAIRGAVSEVFGLALGSVSLIRPGTIPKTASGKVQRSKARDAFLKHELSLLHTWTARSIRQPG